MSVEVRIVEAEEGVPVGWSSLIVFVDQMVVSGRFGTQRKEESPAMRKGVAHCSAGVEREVLEDSEGEHGTAAVEVEVVEFVEAAELDTLDLGRLEVVKT